MASIGTVEGTLTLRDEFTGKITAAAGRLEDAGRRMEQFGAKMTAVGAKLTAAVTLPIVGIGGAALKMAVDATEAENLFEVSFGDMAEAARAWSEETGKALGLNRVELRKQSGVIFTMVESMGLGRDAAFDMATGITELSGDLASFFNLKPEEAFDRIRSGIVGEAEPLRRLGILIDEATIKQVAYQKGIAETGAELTQVQKVQARWLAILDQTTKAQGDLARTLDSPANKIRAIGTAFTEAGQALGIALLPTLEAFLELVQSEIVPALEAMIEWFTELSPAMQKVVVALVALAAAAGPVLVIVGQLAIAFAALGPAGLVVVGTLAAITAGVIIAVRHWDLLTVAVVNSAADVVDFGIAWTKVSDLLAWGQPFADQRRDLELLSEALRVKAAEALERAGQSATEFTGKTDIMAAVTQQAAEASEALAVALKKSGQEAEAAEVKVGNFTKLFAETAGPEKIGLIWFPPGTAEAMADEAEKAAGAMERRWKLFATPERIGMIWFPPGTVDAMAANVEQGITEGSDKAADEAEKRWEEWAEYVGAVTEWAFGNAILSALRAIRDNEDLEKAFEEIFADLGGQVGGAIGSQWGPVGTAIGTFLGETIGAEVGEMIGGIFADSPSAVEQAAAQFGLQLSDALIAEIENTAVIVGDAAAALRQHILDIIAEQGINDLVDLANITGLAQLLLYDVENGLITSAGAANRLGSALSALLDRFEAVGGKIEDLAGLANILVDALDRVALGQLTAADAAVIFNESFAQFVAVAREMGDAGIEQIARIVEAAQAAGIEVEAITLALRDAMTEALAVMEQRNALLLEQSRNLIAGLEQFFADFGNATRREVEFAASAVLSSFAAMQQGGASLMEIVAELGDLFGMIADRGAEIGLDLPPEFARLGEIIDILAQGNVERLFRGLQGLADATAALGNMGLLTADQFDTFGDRVDRIFRRLIAQGLTEEEALAALAPQLQLINDLAEQYGFDIDRNTQRLIDQALAQGLVTEKGLTMEDILIAGFDRMLEALNALIVALGGVPLAFDSIGEQGEQAAEDMADAWIASAERIRVAMEDLAFPNQGGFGVRDPQGGRRVFSAASGSGGFRDFGAGTPAILHGREAVVTERDWAGMVEGALSGRGGGPQMEMLLTKLDRLSGDLRRQQAAIPVAMRDAALKELA